MRHTRSDNSINSARRNSLPLEEGNRLPNYLVLGESEQVVLPRYARYITHVVLLTWLRSLQCSTLTIALIGSTHAAAKTLKLYLFGWIANTKTEGIGMSQSARLPSEPSVSWAT